MKLLVIQIEAELGTLPPPDTAVTVSDGTNTFSGTVNSRLEVADPAIGPFRADITPVEEG